MIKQIQTYFVHRLYIPVTDMVWQFQCRANNKYTKINMKYICNICVQYNRSAFPRCIVMCVYVYYGPGHYVLFTKQHNLNPVTCQSLITAQLHHQHHLSVVWLGWILLRFPIKVFGSGFCLFHSSWGAVGAPFWTPSVQWSVAFAPQLTFIQLPHKATK